jgi:hypothetical protein
MNKNDEWYTPPFVIERVKRVFTRDGELNVNIDLDPASNPISNRWINATRYYTKEDNSLVHDWYADRVFMNPPFSAGLIGKFTKKIHEEFQAGRVKEFICLTNQGTDTIWNSWLRNYTQAFTIGRLSFVDATGDSSGGTSRGQCFTYAGPNLDKFIEVFNDGQFSYVQNIHLLKTKI